MFDAATANFLRSAPELPGLNPNELPAILTRHYAELASMRLRGAGVETGHEEDDWSLERIADTYELVASLQPEDSARAAAAFVAATAQQILARRQLVTNAEEELPSNIDRDRLDPSLAAAILFLASEQYADANEAAANIQTGRVGQIYEATILSEHIVDLAKGRLTQILERAARWRRPITYVDLDFRALAALLEALSTGIEMLAAQMLRVATPEQTGLRFDTPQNAFERVLAISSSADGIVSDAPDGLIISYAGPYHLASLLLAVARSVPEASLLNTPVPSGSNSEVWEQWLRFRAAEFPYLWSNHRQAIDQEFHQTGVSSVVILPTGAGKTTVSSLKIAGVLARGKKVAFLAPTHALVDQLTEDLQEMFPSELLGSVVSSDFDLLMQEDAVFRDIEVMTPERCLAMLSFAADAFKDVGLLVFDECHLLSPETGKIRRALDAMLCVLGFSHVAPDADILFLSAMLKNGEELAQWLGELTGRKAVAVDLLWKPSRQARGVIIYDDSQLTESRNRALEVQAAENKKKKKEAKDLRAPAKRQLTANPYAIWGLQHNWLSLEESIAHCITTQLLERRVTLSGHIKYGSLQLTPNANQVAIDLAAAAAQHSLKTIVFVNTKRDAVSVANEVSDLLSQKVDISLDEQARWDALEAELGNLKHSLLSGPTSAVPHNSAMLRLERDIAERMFKRPNGAQVIVATPTLAQGLNLPAQLAILAGDKRADTVKGGREDLEAHEILNAAARAGRAGHLANGLVLLIPEPIISFKQGEPLDGNVVQKLQAVLPENDHCVTVADPLEIVLDRLMEGQAIDPDVSYTINRMAILRSMDEVSDATHLFDLRKSLGAFAAKRRKDAQAFDAKVETLRQAITGEEVEDVDQNVALLSSQSGLSAKLLIDLKLRITNDIGSLPTNVTDWLEWMIRWLQEDENARAAILGDIKARILSSCGKSKTAELQKEDLAVLKEALIAWVSGKPLREIEAILGGEPEADPATKKACPRAREIVGTIIPRGISFAVGLIAHMVEDVDPFEQQSNLDRQLVECLGTAVRRGFNDVQMLFFSSERRELLSRVQIHEAWKHRLDGVFDEI
ncbi:DEAD/DEAH box helicase [Cohaesibacter celericrescens]|uniref:DEAD/DEAH box helicase n=1 Tax=Cohaesibacter celericrescens TaxID=2067669 RepID=A0A2N5XPS7_9HYPH|nr:DEAD/DEAH box helicase [Cohaesibacter celericrescens]PLW76430.1 DEAD/DEAH box helicase [Cohaesibacter celericrescens]